MSKLTEQLRTIGIFNSCFFADGNIYIDYIPNDNGRGGHSARWQVNLQGGITDPNARWYDYGRKTFVLAGAGNHADIKIQYLEEAKAWASEKYGIKEWARTPFGTWMDAEFVKARLAELKKLIEEKE